ncbi:MAG: GNAT family N-acetyltransferase [Armatimonadota bacterium]|jgi:GNAT superfamily N-acetyltransferase
MEIRGLRREELEEHAELVYSSYAHGRSFDSSSSLDGLLSQRDWWLRAVRTTVGYDPEQTRVMALDGRLVSSVTCYLRPSYAADRVARAVCIGSVCTHPDYRRRGLLRHVLAEAAEWMTRNGILWSFLYGNEAVYGGSGWRHLTSRVVSVDLVVADEVGQEITARPLAEDDVLSLVRMYDAFNSRLTGTTQRSEAYWQRTIFARGEGTPGYLLLERGGVPIGYFCGSGRRLSEIAWTGARSDVLGFVLRQCPGPVTLPLCTTEVLDSLRDIAQIPSQQEWQGRQDSVTISEMASGLWQYHTDPEGLFPEFSDTQGLLRFLRAHDYVMWSADKS